MQPADLAAVLQGLAEANGFQVTSGHDADFHVHIDPDPGEPSQVDPDPTDFTVSVSA